MTSSLQINDLSLTKELDRKALSDVRGGAENKIKFDDFKQTNKGSDEFGFGNINTAVFTPVQVNLENVGNTGLGYYPPYYGPWYA